MQTRPIQEGPRDCYASSMPCLWSSCIFYVLGSASCVPPKLVRMLLLGLSYTLLCSCYGGSKLFLYFSCMLLSSSRTRPRFS